MTDAVKPLACPFCGGTDNLVADGKVLVHALSSMKDTECDLRGVTISLETWNRRTPPAGWKPIETAPKDGTRILLTGGVYWSDGGQGGMGTNEMPLDQIELGFWKSGEWWIGYGGGCYDEEYWAHPIYWMPLPAAPENDDEQENKP